MKYRFSIIAPHPDDEFIGAKKFIETYSNHIDNFVFITNGERAIDGLPDLIQYTMLRRRESEEWIKTVAPQAQIHYLNIPDGITLQSFAKSYPSAIYDEVTGSNILHYCIDKLYNIVSDNILVTAEEEAHPSHALTFQLIELLGNKKIYYKTHLVLSQVLRSAPGQYFAKKKLFDENMFQYFYIYTEEELSTKRIEFQYYYNSQYESLMQSSLQIKNWESYLSAIPLKFVSEDNIFPINKKEKTNV